MYFYFCTSMTIIISFVLFALAYSLQITPSNQHSSNKLHIPITQTLNSNVVLRTSQRPLQGQPSSTGLHISASHLLFTNATQQIIQRRHALDKVSQHRNQNSPVEIYMSPTHPQNIITTQRARQRRHAYEEASRTPNQTSTTGIQISPALPQNTTPQTRQQQLVVKETPQNETSSSTGQSLSLTQKHSRVPRTSRRNIPTNNLQLPNGPPLRYQRPRIAAYPTRQSIRSQIDQQNHGSILQQRQDDVMQQTHGDMVQQSDSLVHSDKRPHGATQKFCNMFGCDCVPPPKAKCCVGYRYDKRANKCRQLA